MNYKYRRAGEVEAFQMTAERRLYTADWPDWLACLPYSVSDGDYLVKDVMGQIHVFGGEYFEKNFEKVEPKQTTLKWRTLLQREEGEKIDFRKWSKLYSQTCRSPHRVGTSTKQIEDLPDGGLFIVDHPSFEPFVKSTAERFKKRVYVQTVETLKSGSLRGHSYPAVYVDHNALSDLGEKGREAWAELRSRTEIRGEGEFSLQCSVCGETRLTNDALSEEDAVERFCPACGIESKHFIFREVDHLKEQRIEALKSLKEGEWYLVDGMELASKALKVAEEEGVNICYTTLDWIKSKASNGQTCKGFVIDPELKPSLTNEDYYLMGTFVR